MNIKLCVSNNRGAWPPETPEKVFWPRLSPNLEEEASIICAILNGLIEIEKAKGTIPQTSNLNFYYRKPTP